MSKMSRCLRCRDDDEVLCGSFMWQFYVAVLCGSFMWQFYLCMKNKGSTQIYSSMIHLYFIYDLSIDSPMFYLCYNSTRTTWISNTSHSMAKIY